MIYRLFLTVFFLVSISLTSFAQEKPMKDMKDKPVKEIVKQTEKQDVVKKNVKDTVKMANNKVCPVSGEKLEDNDITYTYKGVAYGVCCKKCLAKVEKDPEKYISRLAADGKSLKKNLK